MIFFPWLFVAFGFGWCIGRTLLNKWWRANLEKIETSTKENIKKIAENNAEILRLTEECKAAVSRAPSEPHKEIK